MSYITSNSKCTLKKLRVSMKASKLTIEATFNLGNYESIRLGAEFSVDKEKGYDEQMRDADIELRKMLFSIVEQRKAEKQASAAVNTTKKEESITETKNGSQKEKLTIEHPQFQKILKRIESGVKLDKVLEYYEPDEQALNVLNLAVKIN